MTHMKTGLEVWACGGDTLLSHGFEGLGKHKVQRQAAVEKARTVDKKQFFENSFDQEMFLGKTFAHRQQAQNRDA